MDGWPRIPLEDTFGDVLRKAMRGNQLDARALALRTGIDADEIASWPTIDGTATEAQARAIAPSCD